MSTGDSITAGEITTAYDTTDLVAEKKGVGFGGFGRQDFRGGVILRIGPSNNSQDDRMPDTALDGVQGEGNLGGTGLVGLGGPVEDGGGVGVKGIAGGTADGVVGVSDAEGKSGVFGFNAFAQGAQDVAAFGVSVVAIPRVGRELAPSPNSGLALGRIAQAMTALSD